MYVDRNTSYEFDRLSSANTNVRRCIEKVNRSREYAELSTIDMFNNNLKVP